MHTSSRGAKPDGKRVYNLVPMTLCCFAISRRQGDDRDGGGPPFPLHFS